MERIPKALIRKGLEHKLIKFKTEDDLLAVRIGQYGFFICSEYDKTEDDFTQEELIQKIYENINAYPINDENDDDATECLYYKYFLEEQLTNRS